MSLIYRFSTKLTYQGKIRTESGQNQDKSRNKSGINLGKKYMDAPYRFQSQQSKCCITHSANYQIDQSGW